MTEFVDATVRDIDNRLQALKEEVGRLEAARTALLGTRRRPGRPARAAGQTTTPRRGRRPGRPRGRRGGNTRARQTFELVQSQPGITIPQIAEAMKIEPNYLYRVLPKLVADGQVRRDGKGWYPVDVAAANAA